MIFLIWSCLRRNFFSDMLLSTVNVGRTNFSSPFPARLLLRFYDNGSKANRTRWHKERPAYRRMFFFFTPLNFLPPPYRNCVFTRHLTTLMYTGLSKGENFFLAVERSGVIFVETLPDAEKLGGK